MKKRFAAIVMAAGMLMMAACSKDTSDVVYMKDFNAADYVTVGDYQNIEVALAEPEVTDEYLEGYIDYILQNSPVYTPVTDRGVEMGDVTNIDYVGKLDGVAFDGGTAQGQELVIGSGMFIDGFEDGMIGMQIGETRDVEATFPDPYDNNPDLAGKVAVFTVTLNSISLEEIPELTDEYVVSLGLEGCSNVEEYRAYVYDVLMEQQMASFESQKADLALEAVVAASEFKAAPEGMVNRMNETLTANISSYANMYGADIGTYVANVYGGTAAEYEATLLQQSELMAQRYVMMKAIADKEGIEVTDEEMEAAITEEATTYGYTSVDEYKALIDVEAYREYLITMEVMDLLTANAVTTGEKQATEETAQ